MKTVSDLRVKRPEIRPLGMRLITAALAIAVIAGGLTTSEVRGQGFRRCRSGVLLRRSTARGNRVFAPRSSVLVTRPSGSQQPQAQLREGTALLQRNSLDGWRRTNFGGEGEVRVSDGVLILEMGYPLTGVTWTDDFPRTNYEVEFDAKRLEGIDFFCGATFPVADSYCSFIVGGWAGAVVGLSSIDGLDASENETTTYMDFENDRWYHIRIRVTPENISAWIDERQVVDQSIEGRRITTRNEVTLSQPFGLCAYETKAAIRNLRLRQLEPAGHEMTDADVRP